MTLQEEHYYCDKGGCPEWCLCGGQGPLILLSCEACGAIIACCGETDHYIGYYSSPISHGIKRADPEIIDYACPKCSDQLDSHYYAHVEELACFGFVPGSLRQYVGAPDYFVDCRTWTAKTEETGGEQDVPPKSDRAGG